MERGNSGGGPWNFRLKCMNGTNHCSRREVRPVLLEAEVTNISAHGFWLLLGDEELAVPYAEFPWFKKATVEQILAVERPTANHLYWPRLDIDLAVESLRQPQAFPLVSKVDR